ncbi:MAG: RNA polymerase sigma factor [Opitutae bacterium]|nr:RNA polymerase sigma factor [Opitutae bacterium]MBT5691658.1 RNA polymerase sigma factor [Opitutae bacterium]MBT7853880.1 RNA polymerase sigma factor [Opitutae bacterium]
MSILLPDSSPSFSFPGFGIISSMVESDNPSKPDADGDESQTLMLRIASGDDVALTLLINRWKNPLFRFFDRSLNNHADAEDLTQKVFVKLHAAVSRYKPKAKFSTYIFTIARRLLLDEFKRRSRRPEDLTDPLDIKSPIVHGNSRNELEGALEQCLAGIPENQRTALLLRVQRELSYSEIAEIMSASQAAVKTWIYRAREEARKSLSEFRKSNHET